MLVRLGSNVPYLAVFDVESGKQVRPVVSIELVYSKNVNTLRLIIEDFRGITWVDGHHIPLRIVEGVYVRCDDKGPIFEIDAVIVESTYHPDDAVILSGVDAEVWKQIDLGLEVAAGKNQEKA